MPKKKLYTCQEIEILQILISITVISEHIDHKSYITFAFPTLLD